jgi:hypothetical protein
MVTKAGQGTLKDFRINTFFGELKEPPWFLNCLSFLLACSLACLRMESNGSAFA